MPMSHKKDNMLIWVKYFNQKPACYHACVIIDTCICIHVFLNSVLDFDH